MTRMTQNYGVNGTNRDERGRLLEPKELYTRHENFADPAKSATRHFRESYFFEHLVPEFFATNGAKPTKAYTVAPVSNAKSIGRTVMDIGFVMLDIIGGQDRDRVE